MKMNCFIHKRLRVNKLQSPFQLPLFYKAPDSLEMQLALKEKKIQRSKPQKHFKAFDLFCGCGGISCGLKLAGFNLLGGLDCEEKYISSYITNFSSECSFNKDILTLSNSFLTDHFSLRPFDLDLLAGGPPCQGFSKNVPRSQRTVDSDNNVLVNSFISFCEFTKPKAFLMENVAEMRKGFGAHYTHTILKRLSNKGYQIDHEVLNSADFGVPQNRRRAFFIGIHKDFSTNCDSFFNDVLFASVRSPSSFLPETVTVWDAISDLPSLKDGQGQSPASYEKRPASTYQIWARNGSGRLLNHVARKLTNIQKQRYEHLNPGEGIKDLPDHLRPKSGYSGAYGRLKRNMLAPTITRWVFHPGSGRYGHPNDRRVITIREAARLQGFPDWFEFSGSYCDQAGQVGNAVPPKLIEFLARQIKHFLASQ